MKDIFSNPDYWLIWAFVLALSLFHFVRKLIWVLMVRRAAEKITKKHAAGEDVNPLDEQEIKRLKLRAGVTAGLLCFIFSTLYSAWLFGI